MLVLCRNGLSRLGSESQQELHGEHPTACAAARATAAPVEMDCLVHRNILNLIPGFDSDEEFGPFCHQTPFLGDGLGLMTFVNFFSYLLCLHVCMIMQALVGW